MKWQFSGQFLFKRYTGNEAYRYAVWHDKPLDFRFAEPGGAGPLVKQGTDYTDTATLQRQSGTFYIEGSRDKIRLQYNPISWI